MALCHTVYCMHTCLYLLYGFQTSWVLHAINVQQIACPHCKYYRCCRLYRQFLSAMQAGMLHESVYLPQVSHTLNGKQHNTTVWRKELLCTSSKLQCCSTGKVKMSHVDEAINEMFQATHMQMMRSCCRLEKILLAAILLESRSKGKLLVNESSLSPDTYHSGSGSLHSQTIPFFVLKRCFPQPFFLGSRPKGTASLSHVIKKLL